jgi:hypothetical protein
MKSTFFSLTTILALVACTSAQPGSTLSPAAPTEAAAGDTVSAGPVTIHTVAPALEVEAGGSVDVKCYYLDASGVRVSGPAVGLVTDSADTETKVLDERVTLYPEAAGDLHVACASTNGVFVDSDGVDLKVIPGLAASLHVDTDDSDCLLQNVAIPLTVTVLDSFGNQIERPALDVQFIPDTGVTGDLESGFKFSVEGEFDLTIALSGSTATNVEPAVFTQTIHVDETAPELEILAPLRGEMLRLGDYDDAEVSVWVAAEDSVSSVRKVVVDGVNQDIASGDAQHTIETSQTSRWGMSVVSASSEDSCGNVSYVAHAYYRSPAYLPAVTEVNEDAMISNAVVARVSQSFVDDGERETLNDLASIAQAAAMNIELDTEIPAGTVLAEDPYSANCHGGNTDTSYLLSRNSDASVELSMDGPWVHSLNIVDGGIEFQLSVDSIQVPLEVWATASTCMLFDVTWADVETTVDVGIQSVLIDGTFGVSYVDGQPTIALDDFVADFSGTSVDVDCGLVDFACDAISNAARSTIESEVESILQDKVRNEIAPMLEEALGQFAPQSVVGLPAPMEAQLSVATQFSQIEFCGSNSDCDDAAMQGAGMIAFDAQLVPTVRGENIPEDARGAIFRGSSVPTFDPQSDFGLAISDDFINQMFWATWYSGAMNIDVVEQMGDNLPDAVEAATVQVLSPPVVMPGTGETGMMMGLGNILVQTRVDAGALMAGMSGDAGEEIPYIPMNIEATVSARVDGSLALAVDGTKIILEFDEQPELFVEVSRVDNSPLASELGALISSMLPHLLPVLLADVVTAVEIPAVDVGSLVGAENAAPIGLENGRIVHTSDYILAEGDLNPRD